MTAQQLRSFRLAVKAERERHPKRQQQYQVFIDRCFIAFGLASCDAGEYAATRLQNAIGRCAERAS
jgi:hypothetical protein